MTKTPARKSKAPGKSVKEAPVRRQSAAQAEDALPDAGAIAAMTAPVRDFSQSRDQARVRGFLDRLAMTPPQVLLLEGGTQDLRFAAARYWAVTLNCDRRHPDFAPDSAPDFAPDFPGENAAHTREQSQELAVGLPGLEGAAAGLHGPSATATAPPAARAATAGFGNGPAEPAQAPDAPCLSCSACVRMITGLHRDYFLLDGTVGSIKIDEVRAMRSVLGEPPREARRRLVIFREAQALGEAAANSLLKSFEEPLPQTSFILLAPQRERLLPTLVSRSMVLTLPWPDEAGIGRDSAVAWEAALCVFLRTGRDFFERSGSKGAVDAPLAHAIIGLCRRALVAAITSRKSGLPPAEGLASILARLPEARMRMLEEALAECQDSLIYNVNPVLAVEWLATRMYLLLPRQSSMGR